MRKVSLGILLLGLAALISGFFWWNWAAGPVAPKPKIKNQKLKIEEKIFVVRRGEGISSVARRLEEDSLIRSPLAFRILVVKEGLGKKIQAGDFRLHPGMTALEIAQELTHGTLDVWVTVIEGWRTEEIAEAISSRFGVRGSSFIEEAEEYEGRLFPDTYLIPREATAEKIVDIFLKNFDKKFDENLRQEAEKQGLTVKQVLTLASIVEREARLDKDRPIVAGILIKRWQNDWPLQADATVQYIVGSGECKVSREAGSRSAGESQECEWWPRDLTKEDLKINSPYNTYQNKGLPPGPICNPGLASIKAIVYPQKTDYWYYLSDRQGQMYYAKTDEEHTENINRYLK